MHLLERGYSHDQAQLESTTVRGTSSRSPAQGSPALMISHREGRKSSCDFSWLESLTFMAIHVPVLHVPYHIHKPTPDGQT